MKKNTCFLFLFMCSILLAAQSADEFYESGMMRMNEGDYRSAIEEFSRAIELDSLYIEAWTARGDAWEEIGVIYEAEEDWMEAYFLTGNHRFSTGQTMDACNYWSMSAKMGHSKAEEQCRQHCSSGKKKKKTGRLVD
jgi:tetratricopeptide (TPR) repeat protein